MNDIEKDSLEWIWVAKKEERIGDHAILPKWLHINIFRILLFDIRHDNKNSILIPFE
jgi:hypothetical protein